ncbi:hypothetical protein CcCBS67573_g10063 [Chytriomyces confervae]|uniref:G-protein coupled receptors family 1 profile domain-containing protein n=1 Tax=Chytriomyces confervae TaxID=246404 RepID=A0A507DH33_9FUNG|nr:hypothetical protein CcCBS67573_g10063 [Chytriomyces confervae]
MPRLASFANSNTSNGTSANSSIPTLEPDSSSGGGLSISQFALLSIIVGLVIEVSFTGILAITLRMLRKESKNFWKMACLMLLCNVWCIVFMVFSTLSNFADKENCVLINALSNVSAHLFYVTCDVFLLYKTYAVSKCSKTVRAFSVLLLAHRLVWSVWDLAKSGGVVDPVTDACYYYQYPLSGFGYNAVDLVIDVICTLASIVANWNYLFTSFGQLAEVLAKENILRSILILSINSYVMYINLHVEDFMTILVAYMLQNYIYTRAVNAELFWVEERRSAMENSTNGGTGSAGRSGGSAVKGSTSQRIQKAGNLQNSTHQSSFNPQNSAP